MEAKRKFARRTLLVGAGHLGLAAAIGCKPENPGSAMSIDVRPLESLPATELSWLKLRDHFIATVGPRSGEGRPMGSLLVLADATFAPRSRFPLHPHKDMEILSIVTDGELSHHGDQAHDAVVKAREAQLISSRGGMYHAEGNDTDSPTRMLQIWFRPDVRGGEATYYQRTLPPTASGRHLVAGDEGMPLRTDARVWWLDLAPGKEAEVVVEPGRAGYVMALAPTVRLGDRPLADGQGATVGPGRLLLRSEAQAAALWIDLPEPGAA